VHPSSELESVVPADPRQSYDIREVIARVTDGSEFREFKQEYGKTVITVRPLVLGFWDGL
jgi:3-methylcrotonyl-CoA carboxylase beta subunit